MDQYTMATPIVGYRISNGKLHRVLPKKYITLEYDLLNLYRMKTGRSIENVAKVP